MWCTFCKQRKKKKKIRAAYLIYWHTTSLAVSSGGNYARLFASPWRHQAVFRCCAEKEEKEKKSCHLCRAPQFQQGRTLWATLLRVFTEWQCFCFVKGRWDGRAEAGGEETDTQCSSSTFSSRLYTGNGPAVVGPLSTVWSSWVATAVGLMSYRHNPNPGGWWNLKLSDIRQEFCLSLTPLHHRCTPNLHPTLTDKWGEYADTINKEQLMLRLILL